mgnify:CR=1 FL=1
MIILVFAVIRITEASFVTWPAPIPSCFLYLEAFPLVTIEACESPPERTIWKAGGRMEGEEGRRTSRLICPLTRLNVMNTLHFPPCCHLILVFTHLALLGVYTVVSCCHRTTLAAQRCLFVSQSLISDNPRAPAQCTATLQGTSVCCSNCDCSSWSKMYGCTCYSYISLPSSLSSPSQSHTPIN